MLDPKAIVIMDWVGSLFMIGTVWGWLYERLDVPLRRQQRRSARRREAFRRLWLRRGGGRAYRKGLQHWARHGIHLDGLPLAEQLKVTTAALRERERLRASGQATPEQIADWDSLNPPMLTVKRAGIPLLAGALRSDASWMSLGVVISVTESILTGTMAKVLFVIGFLLWNASKAASLWTLP